MNQKLKTDIINICQRLYNKGFIVATDGNVSIRTSEQNIIFTPSGVCKGMIKEEDLLITDMSGNILEGQGKVTTEILMHLKIYELRPDICSVVHSHPPTLISLTYANIDISDKLLPEVIITVGEVPLIPYKTTGTKELADEIGKYAIDHDAFLMEKHGLTTAGKDIFEAFFKTEKLEHNAIVIQKALSMGAFNPLTSEQKKSLFELRNLYK